MNNIEQFSKVCTTAIKSVAVIGLGLIMYSFILKTEKLEIQAKTPVIVKSVKYIEQKIKVIQFSEKQLIKQLKKLNVKHIAIVVAQARVETGYYKSNIYKDNNNIFGMKLAKQRPTTAIGENRGHANYKNWIDSAMDYAIFQSSYARKLSENEYLNYLKSTYAESKYTILDNVIEKVKTQYSNL